MAWKHRTVKQELEIVDLSGRHTQRQIAEMTGMSMWTVGAVQRKYHIVTRFGRSYGSAQFRKKDQWDPHIWGPLIEELYSHQRLTQLETARRLGIGKGCLRRRLLALGIEPRTSGQSNQGKKRTGYNYTVELPRCACGTGIRVPGAHACARCRRAESCRAETERVNQANQAQDLQQAA